MHNRLSNKTCVRLLKCVYYGLNRNQTGGYAYRKLRFCSNHNVLATAAVQENCREVSGQDPRMGFLPLEPLACAHVRNSFGVLHTVRGSGTFMLKDGRPYQPTW